jgi:hypothetical protein
MSALFEERPRKVHLSRDQSGRVQRGSGRPVDNTLCASNHGDRGLLKTDDPRKVTCKRCLKLMEDSPVGQLEVMLTETSKHLSEAEDLLDRYRRRQDRLERTLRFALNQLGDDRHVLVHAATDFGVGDLIEAVLADTVKEEQA